jgi:hypothetical protein
MVAVIGADGRVRDSAFILVLHLYIRRITPGLIFILLITIRLSIRRRLPYILSLEQILRMVRRIGLTAPVQTVIIPRLRIVRKVGKPLTPIPAEKRPAIGITAMILPDIILIFVNAIGLGGGSPHKIHMMPQKDHGIQCLFTLITQTNGVARQ